MIRIDDQVHQVRHIIIMIHILWIIIMGLLAGDHQPRHHLTTNMPVEMERLNLARRRLNRPHHHPLVLIIGDLKNNLAIITHS